MTATLWSAEVGHRPFLVHVEERTARKSVAYLRWWDVEADNWRMASTGIKVRDGKGRLLPEATSEAIDAANAKVLQLQGGAHDPVLVGTPLTLEEGWLRVSHPETGRWPMNTPHRREAERSDLTVDQHRMVAPSRVWLMPPPGDPTWYAGTWKSNPLTVVVGDVPYVPESRALAAEQERDAALRVADIANTITTRLRESLDEAEQGYAAWRQHYVDQKAEIATLRAERDYLTLCLGEANASKEAAHEENAALREQVAKMEEALETICTLYETARDNSIAYDMRYVARQVLIDTAAARQAVLDAHEADKGVEHKVMRVNGHESSVDPTGRPYIKSMLVITSDLSVDQGREFRITDGDLVRVSKVEPDKSVEGT